MIIILLMMLIILCSMFKNIFIFSSEMYLKKYCLYMLEYNDENISFQF